MIRLTMPEAECRLVELKDDAKFLYKIGKCKGAKVALAMWTHLWLQIVKAKYEGSNVV